MSAPAFAASSRDGQLRGERAEGFYDHDRRLLHTLCLLLDDREPEPIGVQPLGPHQVRFTAVHRYPRDRTDDPTLIVERVRTAGDGETITLRNIGMLGRRLRVELVAASDLADIADVKRGHRRPVVRCTAAPASLAWSSPAGRARIRVLSGPEPETSGGPEGGTLTWSRVVLRPGECWTVQLCVDGSAIPTPPGHPVAPTDPAPWNDPVIESDRRLKRLVRRGLADLSALRLADPQRRTTEGSEDQFIAAGCPWYLTLFGRDSIWSARMMLPLGTDLARGTLWSLARRQGRVHEHYREEAPGRILHELRPAEAQHGHGLLLPASYYGSVDATPLFVTLLVEAWQWGLPDKDVDALLPYAERAMAWVVATSKRDEGGLLRYYPRAGGLRHQSWKDSDDAVRDAEGRHIEPPLALCEVQGYAYEAAMGLARLQHSRGRYEAAQRLLVWAASLRKRFSEAFWIPARNGPAPRYVAIAVGHDLSPVSGPASNMGQLLSTGILDPEGSADVAAWLAHPDLNSGWGLRSRSAAVPGFNPLSYHGGSVWTHDTAIAVQGLCAAGHHEEASALVDGLLDAASHFSYRMPELYAGDARTEDSPAPLAYPAACRPQGWSAASGVAVLSALLGLKPDITRQTLCVNPVPRWPMTVREIVLAGRGLTVQVDKDGEARISGLPEGWRVTHS
ncbi:glycogen debranching N-terminal domain-containing protein [Streptomyces sp. V4I2]|uniref:glycogen debranching N-terminal domain-containing protein n=1 Tax=Streptomyces sp. V4I2 TaxID=3042280 RepID=UPI0027D901F7|nr:glycogen debranching N-terminal domain-containing protein [Streptomyces sp. V4I2]